MATHWRRVLAGAEKHFCSDLHIQIVLEPRWPQRSRSWQHVQVMEVPGAQLHEIRTMRGWIASSDSPPSSRTRTCSDLVYSYTLKRSTICERVLPLRGSFVGLPVVSIPGIPGSRSPKRDARNASEHAAPWLCKPQPWFTYLLLNLTCPRVDEQVVPHDLSIICEPCKRPRKRDRLHQGLTSSIWDLFARPLTSRADNHNINKCPPSKLQASYYHGNRRECTRP